MSRSARHVPPTPRRFVPNASVAAEPVKRLEGEAPCSSGASIVIKPLLAGEDMLLLEVHRQKGLVDARHAHPDHESICYLVSGRMRVVFDDGEFIAGPGDSWIHPPGVLHYHETLEDSVQIEIKSPPIKTWG